MKQQNKAFKYLFLIAISSYFYRCSSNNEHQTTVAVGRCRNINPCNLICMDSILPGGDTYPYIDIVPKADSTKTIKYVWSSDDFDTENYYYRYGCWISESVGPDMPPTGEIEYFHKYCMGDSLLTFEFLKNEDSGIAQLGYKSVFIGNVMTFTNFKDTILFNPNSDLRKLPNGDKLRTETVTYRYIKSDNKLIIEYSSKDNQTGEFLTKEESCYEDIKELSMCWYINNCWANLQKCE